MQKLLPGEVVAVVFVCPVASTRRCRANATEGLVYVLRRKKGGGGREGGLGGRRRAFFRLKVYCTYHVARTQGGNKRLLASGWVKSMDGTRSFQLSALKRVRGGGRTDGRRKEEEENEGRRLKQRGRGRAGGRKKRERQRARGGESQRGRRKNGKS